MNTYHKSIDGLRAIALLGVVFYHCGVTVFSGGYTGVDVFFVISGYLIIPSIISRLEADKFSITEYLERRIRRIVPVMVVMLFVVSIAAYFILLPKDLDFYGLSLMGASSFVPNVIFDKAFSYFASAATPIIHLWSIGVEVQFYIGILVFFVFLHKTQLFDKSLYIILFLSLATLVASELLIANHGNPIFYYTPFRFWEFGVGALVSLGMFPTVRHRISDNLLSIVGLVLLLSPMFIYDSTWVFPGMAAVPSCLGAAILLYCVDSDALITKVLRNPVLVSVGKASYSIYIWHWPIVLFFEYSLGRSVTASDITLLLIVIFAVGYLSWYFIEIPFQNKKIGANRRVLFTGALGALSVFAVIGGTFTQFDGFPGRLPQAAREILEVSERHISTVCPDSGEDIRRRARTDTYCVIGDQKASPTWALWGDSHARALRGPFDQILKENNASALLLGLHACPVLLNVNTTYYLSGLCKVHNQHAYQRVANNPDIKHVLILSRYAMYLYGTITDGIAGQKLTIKLMGKDGHRIGLQERINLFQNAFEDTMAKLVSLGKDVHVVMPIPEAPFFIPSIVAQRIWKGEGVEDLQISESYYHELNDVVLSTMHKVDQKYPGKINWINPQDLYCENGACKVMLDGNILYRDSNHPSIVSANILLSPIERQMSGQNP
ncbi:acyltransferase [Thalassospira sp. MA62]|nr:acyltransferase [Thalassospira sp. MA62]